MTEKTENTDSVITSWMVLSCAVVNSYEPMRFAGTWKQYSKKAMPQLARITFHSASLRYLRWPYHAKVMKMLEIVSSKMVRTRFSAPDWDEFSAFQLYWFLRKKGLSSSK